MQGAFRLPMTKLPSRVILTPLLPPLHRGSSLLFLTLPPGPQGILGAVINDLEDDLIRTR